MVLDSHLKMIIYHVIYSTLSKNNSLMKIIKGIYFEFNEIQESEIAVNLDQI